MLSLADLTPCPAPSTSPAGQRVLDTAAELFYWRGFGHTSVDLIVAQAGATKSTLYQRFASKDELFAAYLRQHAHAWQSYLLEGLRGWKGSSLECLYSLVTQWARQHTRGSAFVNAWVEIADAGHPGSSVIRAQRQWTHELYRILAEGDADLAHTWHLLYEGAQISAAIQGSTQPFHVALASSKRAAATRAPQ